MTGATRKQHQLSDPDLDLEPIIAEEPVGTRSCGYCPSRLEHRRADAVYCSSSCRVRACRARRRARGEGLHRGSEGRMKLGVNQEDQGVNEGARREDSERRELESGSLDGDHVKESEVS